MKMTKVGKFNKLKEEKVKEEELVSLESSEGDEEEDVLPPPKRMVRLVKKGAKQTDEQQRKDVEMVEVKVKEALNNDKAGDGSTRNYGLPYKRSFYPPSKDVPDNQLWRLTRMNFTPTLSIRMCPECQKNLFNSKDKSTRYSVDDSVVLVVRLCKWCANRNADINDKLYFWNEGKWDKAIGPSTSTVED
jgi:hypothetical protein